MANSVSDPRISGGEAPSSFQRAGSVSQASEKSQTAQEFISSQLQLEADAREALPYQFDTCTRPLGPLRQLLFSCLTCNPPPASADDSYTPAGVCYSCSISCHGEHTLVELFNKRNFECDCGTTRIASSAPCTLRPDARGQKGALTGEEPAKGNKYNQNFGNRFCGCSEDYNPHTEKGTMFQCLGLEGGCGEDWWHPECLVGLPRGWWRKGKDVNANGDGDGAPKTEEEDDEGEAPLPPGFPNEDDFDGLLCYKCVDAHPWLKRYTGATGFLPAVLYNPPTGSQEKEQAALSDNTAEIPSKKRKADDDDEGEADESSAAKRQRSSSEDAAAEAAITAPSLVTVPLPVVETPPATAEATAPPTCLYEALPAPQATKTPISLLLKPDFRDHLCHCPTHFPLLTPHPPLLNEEETYEPPLSESSHNGDGAGSVGSKSLLDRGEAALSNMDRVRAIEGVMVYNHLRDKVKDFLQPFAESGKVVGAEDIKKYFETLRGDAEAMRAMRAQQQATAGGGGEDDDQRREQGGY